MDWRLTALQLLSGVALILTAALVADVRNNQASFTMLVSAGTGIITNAMPSLADKNRRSYPPPPLGSK